MRGNCPRFQIVVYGKNFAGPHHIWIDPASYIELSGRAYLCAKGRTYTVDAEWTNCSQSDKAGVNVVGVVLSGFIWDGVSPGPKTVWIDGRPVPFELVIRGYPDANREPQPALVALRALGDGGAPLDRITEGVGFVLEATYDGAHPDEWVAVELPGLQPAVFGGELRVADDDAAADGGVVGKHLPPRSVVLRRTGDKTVFRSDLLAVRAAARRGR